ncbi:hypothetical protein E2562_018638 [Oryza meyeriana var. granulata]|uniref:DUF4220 domain-containing protein n=1 Tax=Oryza meyeriana var. granulata TaxID=110450 RepID=A0A6G1BYR4_9ORYZ|nr:hypothetical protein E2562_018638 [Oryza meyeriana var. granulata]
MTNSEEAGSHHVVKPKSLADVEYLLNEWEIHCLILISFALQVFLLCTAGIRRRTTSSVVGLAVWLAYLSADSVALFVLGHLAVHAGGPNHQLVLLWAPFVLLHLGGQDTITAFSMQDNELWTRHLLTFAQQVALALYDVAKSPWPDRRLLAAVVLMFLSGCIKYAERTICLATASQARLMVDFLGGFKDRINSIKEMQTIAQEGGLGSSRYLSSRAFSKFSLNPAMDVMSTDILPNYDWSVSCDIFSDLYSKVSRHDPPKQDAYFRKMYRFVEESLFVCFQRLYTKAPFRLSPLGASLHLVTFLSTSAAMVLFCIDMRGHSSERTYSSADVTVSYVLLAGAVTLEVLSFILSMYTRQNLWSHPVLCSCIQFPAIIKCMFCMTCGNCAYLQRRWRPPQHWSQKLEQYSLIGRSAQLASGKSSLLPPRFVVERLRIIGIEIDTAKNEHVPFTDDLKLLVIKKLLDPDAMLTGSESSDFTRSRGEMALKKWMGILKIRAGTERILRESLTDVDFPTSVLVWHVATNLCFFDDQDDDPPRPPLTTSSTNRDDDKKKKIISRQLSNYIMYLVYKCGVMRTSSSQFLLLKAQEEIIRLIKDDGKGKGQGGDHKGKKRKKGYPARESGSVERLVKSAAFERCRRELAGDQDDASSSSTFLSSGIDVLSDVVLPRAFKLATALAGTGGQKGGGSGTATRWDLIVAVWLEMLYYIAPRCGAAFHREHLSTGGEFVTHVLVLMYIIGPLGYHPAMLNFESLNR